MTNESGPQGFDVSGEVQNPQTVAVKYTVTQSESHTPYVRTFRIEPPMPQIGELFLRGATGNVSPTVLEAEFIATNALGTYIAVVAGESLDQEVAARVLIGVGQRIQALANHPEKALDMSAAQLLSTGQFRSPF